MTRINNFLNKLFIVTNTSKAYFAYLVYLFLRSRLHIAVFQTMTINSNFVISIDYLHKISILPI